MAAGRSCETNPISGRTKCDITGAGVKSYGDSPLRSASEKQSQFPPGRGMALARVPGHYGRADMGKMPVILMGGTPMLRGTAMPAVLSWARRPCYGARPYWPCCHGRDAHATGHGHTGRVLMGETPMLRGTAILAVFSWAGAQRPDTRTSNPGPWAFDKRSELPSGRDATRANREIGGPGDAGPAGDVSHCPTIPVFHHSSVPAGCRLEERSRFRKEFELIPAAPGTQDSPDRDDRQ